MEKHLEVVRITWSRGCRNCPSEGGKWLGQKLHFDYFDVQVTVRRDTFL